MSNLVLLNGGGGNGHASASQRREMLLQAKVEHFQSLIAVLVVQMGGKAIIPGAALRVPYDLGVAADPESGSLSIVAVPIDDAPPAEPAKEPT